MYTLLRAKPMGGCCLTHYAGCNLGDIKKPSVQLNSTAILDGGEFKKSIKTLVMTAMVSLGSNAVIPSLFSLFCCFLLL